MHSSPRSKIISFKLDQKRSVLLCISSKQVNRSQLIRYRIFDYSQTFAAIFCCSSIVRKPPKRSIAIVCDISICGQKTLRHISRQNSVAKHGLTPRVAFCADAKCGHDVSPQIALTQNVAQELVSSFSRIEIYAIDN